MMEKAELMKLQNGSDVRGVAVEGIEREHVNLTEEAANRIATGFVRFLEKKTGRSADKLKIMELAPCTNIRKTSNAPSRETRNHQ